MDFLMRNLPSFLHSRHDVEDQGCSSDYESVSSEGDFVECNSDDEMKHVVPGSYEKESENHDLSKSICPPLSSVSTERTMSAESQHGYTVKHPEDALNQIICLESAAVKFDTAKTPDLATTSFEPAIADSDTNSVNQADVLLASLQLRKKQSSLRGKSSLWVQLQEMAFCCIVNK
jgi:hypothetical protein